MIALTRRSAVAAILMAPLLSCARSGGKTASFAEIAVQVPVAMVYVARVNGYWQKAGLEVETSSFSTGRLAIDALLGNAAQFSNAAVTPLALAALQSTGFRIISQLSVSPNEISIVVRRSSGIKSPADLEGKRIGYPIGTQAEYFFDKYIGLHRLDKSRMTIVSASPPDCVTAIGNGDIDAIVTFKPHSLNAMTLLGENGQTLDTRGLYTSIASLICSGSVSDNEPELVRAILLGLIEAERFIAREPQRAIALVAKEVNLNPSLLARYFQEYSFKAVLSAELVEALRAEGEWGARNRKTTAQVDYRSLIADRHLRSIDPRRVSI